MGIADAPFTHEAGSRPMNDDCKEEHQESVATHVLEFLEQGCIGRDTVFSCTSVFGAHILLCAIRFGILS